MTLGASTQSRAVLSGGGFPVRALPTTAAVAQAAADPSKGSPPPPRPPPVVQLPVWRGAQPAVHGFTMPPPMASPAGSAEAGLPPATTVQMCRASAGVPSLPVHWPPGFDAERVSAAAAAVAAAGPAAFMIPPPELQQLLRPPSAQPAGVAGAVSMPMPLAAAAAVKQLQPTKTQFASAAQPVAPPQVTASLRKARPGPSANRQAQAA